MTGVLWRRAIEAEFGVEIRAVHARLGGDLSPSWLGFRLRLDRVTVFWKGGLFGYRTRIVREAGPIDRNGLVSLDELLDLFPEQEDPAGEPTGSA
ncbi:MAG: hypothetical protein KC912_04885 [Proteobacteria bacterium]|nr:hypothetical protein [Pseudomonadota bacterium]